MKPTDSLALETEAVDADLAHRQAKARKFIELIEAGNLHPQVWKDLDADDELISLERAARLAAAEVKVAWFKNRANQARPWWTWLLPEPGRHPND